MVAADSAVELAGLEALIRAAPTLQLVASSLGRAGLSQQLADAQPDVLLERLWPGLAPATVDAATVPRVVLLAEHEFPDSLVGLVEESGIRAVLPAWASAKEILAAVEAAAAGLVVLHPDVAERIAATASSPLDSMPVARETAPGAPTGQQLSPRESEILNLLAAGLGNKEIAGQLKISEHTVKFHITSIFNKLGASGQAEAVAIGMRRGLISL